jgi:DNA-directed RNA polymerase specialized sigma24 family protein
MQLIDQCLAKDSQAWGKLVEIYDDTAAHLVRQALLLAGFDRSQADDVAVEIFQRLYENECRRLSSFKGDSDRQLKSWLVRVALNFTRDWIKKSWRSGKRQKKAEKACATELASDAPTETKILSLLKALEEALSDRDVHRLRQYLGQECLPSDLASERTKRRRNVDLERKVRKCLGLRPGRARRARKRGEKT